MTKLLPILRITPVCLFVYGIVLTLASLAEVQATTSAAGINSSLMTEVRVSYIAAIIRSFYDLFYLWGLALISMAALKYLERNSHVLS